MNLWGISHHKFLISPAEPDYEFDKPLEDTDAFEKETAEFVCEVSDKDARVQWFLEDKVGGMTR